MTPSVRSCRRECFVTPEYEAVSDADREWFLARPARRYRLRPKRVGELLPGQTMPPGDHVVVARAGVPVRAGTVPIRLRIPVGRPPLPLRRDTDRCCCELIQRLDRAGFTVNGMPLGPLIAELSSAEGPA